MKYLGTAFSLTLGAWRLRVRIDLDDEPDEPAVHRPVRATECVRSESERATSR